MKTRILTLEQVKPAQMLQARRYMVFIIKQYEDYNTVNYNHFNFRD